MFSGITSYHPSNISYLPYISPYPPYISPINSQGNLCITINAPTAQPQIIFLPKIQSQTMKFDFFKQEVNYSMHQFHYSDKIQFKESDIENEVRNNSMERMQCQQHVEKIQLGIKQQANYFSELPSSENQINPEKKKSIYKKKPETKNLIKNSGRAILTFIIKSTELRQKVLKHLGIKESQFLESVYSFRTHIHTISAIRYLWQNHPFCKAFRILSCEYLRKHNLHHIFNSRVFKHSVYLKYQQKLRKSLERPQEFQSIKQL